MDSNSITQNWKRIKVEDIALRVHYGYTASSTLSDTGTRMLRITDIQNYSVDWLNVPFCNIDIEDVGKFRLIDGDIVFARTGGTVGKSFLIQGKIPQAVFASYLIRIQLSKFINPKYLYYFFQSADYWKQIGIKAMGIGQPNVNATSLSQVSLLLCPLVDQNLIVTKLEELFSDLEQSISSLKSAEDLTQVYRQALLNSAFDGGLTNKWRSDNDVMSAGDLLAEIKKRKRDFLINKSGVAEIDFEKIALRNPVLSVQENETTSINVLPKTWRFVKLTEIGMLTSGQHILEKDYNFQKEGIPYLTGPSDFGEVYPLISKWSTTPKAIAEADDILITVKGSGVGKINMMNFTGAIGRQIMAFNSFYKNKKFLFYYFKAKFKSLQNLSSGSAIPGIGRESILNFLCPLIDENEQNEIVLEIEKQISVIETLEQNIRHSQAHAIVLRQNILDKAYQGKLIGASNTGDTKSLLEQIKVEKKDYITKKQNTKRTPKVRSIMSQNKLTILEVLQSSKKPMLAKDVWEKSKHDDIEEFYAALKKLQDAVVEIDKGFLALVK